MNELKDARPKGLPQFYLKLKVSSLHSTTFCNKHQVLQQYLLLNKQIALQLKAKYRPLVCYNNLMRKVAVFDVDGTLFRSGLYREVIFELLRQKIIPPEAQNIFSDEEINWRKRKGDESFVQYNDKIIDVLHQNLTRLKVKDYQKASQRVVEKMGDYCYVFTRNLVKKLGKDGYYLVAISGSPHEAVELFTKRLGFDLAVGADYKKGTSGYFTGELGEPHTWYDKEKVLEQILDWSKFTMKDSCAIGDTMGDASLLAIVDNPIAFNPQKELFQLAKKEGWPVVIERKNMIYHLEPTEKGYVVKC